VRTEILTHFMLRVLLEASKIATDLFVSQICTCEVSISLAIFL